MIRLVGSDTLHLADCILGTVGVFVQHLPIVFPVGIPGLEVAYFFSSSLLFFFKMWKFRESRAIISLYLL